MILFLALGSLACVDLPHSNPPWTQPDDSDYETPETGSPTTPGPTTGELVGPCEASALAPSEGGWLVADNEEESQLFRFDADFAPLGASPLSQDVGDIEALAVDGDTVWVVSSQSTNADGELKEKRSRILRPDGILVTLDLTACPRCKQMYGIPSENGGLNVEGAEWRGDRLWLGLRSPLSTAGNALLLVVTDQGLVEQVQELDLGGRGVRALVPVSDTGTDLLIVAGPTTGGNDPHTLWRLGASSHLEQLSLTLPPSTEGAALDPAAPGTFVYVTDGAGKPGECTTAATWGRVNLP